MSYKECFVHELLFIVNGTIPVAVSFGSFAGEVLRHSISHWFDDGPGRRRNRSKSEDLPFLHHSFNAFG